jgi:kynurenine 3-monooxygenase
MSRYELVSFTTTPYAQIPSRVRRQNLVVAGVALGSLVVAGAAGAALRRAAPRKFKDHDQGGAGAA